LTVPGAAARAQAPGAPATGTLPDKKYTHSKGFKLPFDIKDRDRAGINEVRLYVKTSPTDAWSFRDSVAATDGAFTYRAAEDGEYWFLVVTVDKSGIMVPADLSKENPGVIVVIDTQPPEVEVRPLRTAAGETLLQCEMHDANPDYGTVRMEYQAADQSWKALEPLPEPGLFRVPDPSVLTGVVRVSAADRAGNAASREIRLGTPAAPTAAATPAPSATTPVATASGQGEVVPAGFSQAPSPTCPTECHADKVAAPVPTSDHASTSPAAPSSAGSASSPSRQIINGTHASLEYQVDPQGPSGVGKVEVWATRDEGQTWQRLCEDPDHRSPVALDLPGEGLFGLKLVASNGRGFGGTPPVKGDVPDWWVEVDTTRPQAQLVGAEPGSAADAGCLVISWNASDRNLGPEPVDLYYAARHDGPWLTIAKGIKNSGCHRWVVPPDVGAQIFVRLEVTDRAGNSCRCELQQPVVLDLSRPKVRVLGIAASSPRPTPPSGN
jgi:hypothetical protein